MAWPLPLAATGAAGAAGRLADATLMVAAGWAAGAAEPQQRARALHDGSRRGGHSRLLVGDGNGGSSRNDGRSGNLNLKVGGGSGFTLDVGVCGVGRDTTGQDQAGGSSDNRGLAAHATGVVADGLGNDSQRVGLGDLGAVPCNSCTCSHYFSLSFSSGPHRQPKGFGRAGILGVRRHAPNGDLAKSVLAKNGSSVLFMV